MSHYDVKAAARPRADDLLVAIADYAHAAPIASGQSSGCADVAQPRQPSF